MIFLLKKDIASENPMYGVAYIELKKVCVWFFSLIWLINFNDILVSEVTKFNLYNKFQCVTYNNTKIRGYDGY